MDSGYYEGGFANGLLYFPPPSSNKQEPILIPWSELLKKPCCPKCGEEKVINGVYACGYSWSHYWNYKIGNYDGSETPCTNQQE